MSESSFASPDGLLSLLSSLGKEHAEDDSEDGKGADDVRKSEHAPLDWLIPSFASMAALKAVVFEKVIVFVLISFDGIHEIAPLVSRAASVGERCDNAVGV